MNMPASMILNGSQRQLVQKFWPKMSPSEKINFKSLLETQENELKKGVVQLCLKDPSFLKRFKTIRQKRKKRILNQTEQREQKDTAFEAQEKLNQL